MTNFERCFEKVLVIAGIIITFLAVNCGGLSSPINGSISGNLTVYPNIVTFSCDPGFILRGSSVRKCQSNGTWDGYETVCQGKYSRTSPQGPPWGQTKVASVEGCRYGEVGSNMLIPRGH